MAILKQNQMALYFRREVDSPASAIGIGRYGGEDGSSPGPGKGVTWVQDINGLPLAGLTFLEAPGGLPTKVINFFEQDIQNHLLRAGSLGRRVAIQDRFHKYGGLDNPTGWRKIFHYGGGLVGTKTIGAGAVREYSGAGVVSSVPVVFDHDFEFIRPRLTTQVTPAANVNATGIVFVDDLFQDMPGYPGPDRIGFVSLTAATGVKAHMLVTKSGGGSWANMGATQPFANDEHFSGVTYRVIGTKVRVVTWTSVTDAGAKGKIAFIDRDFGDPAASGTWTVVLTTQGTNGDVVQYVAWPWLEEMLIAYNDNLHLSTNQGESWNDDPIYSGDEPITKIVKVPPHPDLDEAVYVIGENDTILYKQRGNNSVDALVGPGAGSDFTALAAGYDGVLYAGYGTTLARSTDGASTTGGWETVKDFGTLHAVRKIFLAKDDPEFIVAVVEDTDTPGGAAWLSADYGYTWEQTPELANEGYREAYFSRLDVNFAIIAGASDTVRPVLHKLAP